MGLRAELAVALLALAAVAAAGPQLDPELAELAQAVREGCAADSGVADALLAAVDAGGELPAERALQCYVLCTMETAGMMADGRVDEEAVLALLPDALAAGLAPGVRSCGTQAGADHCETAYLTQLCWQRTDPASYIFI